MTIPTIIGGVIGSILTVLSSLTLLPRFQKIGHWADPARPRPCAAIYGISDFALLCVLRVREFLFIRVHLPVSRAQSSPVGRHSEDGCETALRTGFDGTVKLHM